jgi:hypothetical protein
MQQAAAQGTTWNPWVIAIIALVGVLLIVLAIVLLLRARKSAAAAPPPAPKPRRLRAVYADFERSLPGDMQQAEVIVVIGERRSGKSSLAAAALTRGGAATGVIPSVTEDARITLHAGRQCIVLEIAGELLEDGRPDTRSELRKLLAPIALRVPVVLFVVDTRAASYTPAGLRRLGALGREFIDQLTALRKSAPHVRVCLTRLDESLEGVSELVPIAAEHGHADALLVPASRRSADLATLLAPLEPCLTPAMVRLTAPEIGRMTRLFEGGAGRTLGALEPFFDSLLAAGSSFAVPPLDGLVLAALPEGGAGGLIGDPLVLDGGVVATDRKALEQRRLYRAIAVGAVFAGMFAGLYLWHWRRVQAVPGAVAAFTSMRLPRNQLVDNAEARAADALRSALEPLWPPLHLAYPDRKKAIEMRAVEPGGEQEQFLNAVRSQYLLPPTKAPDLDTRLYAVALLRADKDSDLGDFVLDNADVFARVLDVPSRVVKDYVELSPTRFGGPLEGIEEGVARYEWDGFLRALDAALKKRSVSLKEIRSLQDASTHLSDALRGVDSAPLRKDLEALLRRTSPIDAEKLLGPGGSQEVPDWARQKSKELEGLFGMVAQANIGVPDASGKTLRQVVDDLGTMPCPRPETASKETYPIDRDRVYRAADWDRLVASSRSSTYVKAFVDDVNDTRRSPFFFPEPPAYPAVGGADMPGRGASRTLPGLFTARAVQDELIPALTRLDGALETACVSQASREELSRLVREAMDRYAAAYNDALLGYVRSFAFSSGSLASLQADLQNMITPDSWFGRFWQVVADNAAIDPQGNAYLQILANKLSTFQPIVALCPEKGKPVNLDKYYAILAPLLPSLEDGALGPSGVPLGDRLPPVGKLGLSLLDPAPAPWPQVKAWLDAARIPSDLRTPFRLPVTHVYERALGNVENAVEKAYARDVRPLAEPFWTQFPFAPDATAEVAPGEVQAVLGPKGTLRLAFDQVVGPVVVKGDGGAYIPRHPQDYRAVSVPAEALALGRWLDGVNGLLFDEAGKPKALVLSVQPGALPQFEKDDSVAVTKSYLVAGDARVEGFNQTAAWKDLAVAWTAAPQALVGVDLTDPKSGAVTARTRAGTGETWQFFRLVCGATSWRGDTVMWLLGGAAVSFQVKPDPWAKLTPPGHRRWCPARPVIEGPRTAAKTEAAGK